MWSNWILELDRGKYFLYEGNYSTYLEKKAKRLEQEEREESGRQKAIKDELEWIRQIAQGPPDQVARRVSASSTSWSKRQEKRTVGKAQIVIQVPERLGGKVIEVNGISQGLWRQAAVRGPLVHPAAGRHRRRDRPQRRRQVDPVQADHRPGTARQRLDRRSATRSTSAMSTRAATPSIPRIMSGRKFPAGIDYMTVGKQEM